MIRCRQHTRSPARTQSVSGSRPVQHADVPTEPRPQARASVPGTSAPFGLAGL
jgi:hypothetical protein